MRQIKLLWSSVKFIKIIGDSHTSIIIIISNFKSKSTNSDLFESWEFLMSYINLYEFINGILSMLSKLDEFISEVPFSLFINFHIIILPSSWAVNTLISVVTFFAVVIKEHKILVIFFLEESLLFWLNKSNLANGTPFKLKNSNE